MRKFLFPCLVAVVSVVSCTRELVQDAPEAQNTGFDKIINTKSGASTTELLVKFDSPLSSEEIAAMVSDGVIDIEPLFNSVPGKEALESKHGLDRWYILSVSESDDIESVACRFAALKKSEVIQYNKFFHSSSAEDTVIPASVIQQKTASEPQTFNDPYLDLQWHYRNTGSLAIAPNAYPGGDINVWNVWKELTCGDPDIVVAVVDEGVWYQHPDLNANMWYNTAEAQGQPGVDDDNNGFVDDVYGYNFAERTCNLNWTLNSHGTHCAGTIAAVNNNGIGVCGVAGGSGKGDGCRIMSCQAMLRGSGSTANVSKAMKYAADNGASVLSCSIGETTEYKSDNAYIAVNSAEYAALKYFEDPGRGVPVIGGGIAVFSAGNEGKGYSEYPGALAEIISVSALGPDLLPTHYTNYGPGCNVCAPGGEAYLSGKNWKALVLSTVSTEPVNSLIGESQQQGHAQYGYMQGTSMACPHVSGVVALALSYAKKLGKTFDHQKFKEMVVTSTQDIDSRLVGTKTYAYHESPLDLTRFYHKVGTGAIDAWTLMMKIEGTPVETAMIGAEKKVSLVSAFGGAARSLTYLDVKVSQETIDALGLQKISAGPWFDKEKLTDKPTPECECYAYVQFGNLYIHPTKIGSGKITISVVGGGYALGGGDKPTGGMEVTQELSIISRYSKSNNGGWL